MGIGQDGSEFQQGKHQPHHDLVFNKPEGDSPLQLVRDATYVGDPRKDSAQPADATKVLATNIDTLRRLTNPAPGDDGQARQATPQMFALTKSLIKNSNFTTTDTPYIAEALRNFGMVQKDANARKGYFALAEKIHPSEA